MPGFRKGDLSLSSGADLFSQGYVGPGDANASYLIDLLRKWITAGAVWPEGLSYGATDEFGRRAELNPTTVWDFYATVLHLLGFDHTKLTWYHNGLDRRLTDVHGHLIEDILS